MKKLSNKDTLTAKIDIVATPNNIKYYSIKRLDYTELAITAIQNKPNTIKYIPTEYKDYALLCEEAIKQDATVFSLINNKVSNYKKLGTIAITTYPFLVSYVSKDSNYYIYFWELAISTCYKTLNLIDEENSELFPLIFKNIIQEPNAIFFVNSNISIYNDLCKIANNKNSNSKSYMDINKLDKELVFEILKKEPSKIRYLNNTKEYYLEACEMVLKIDGTQIKNICASLSTNNQEIFYKLLNIAKEKNPEVINYPNVINLMRIFNRKTKETIENNCPDNKILNDLDLEYKALTKRLIEAENNESNNKKENETIIHDCPIKKKILINR